MINHHLTLNAVLNIAWYATNVTFQLGQEHFHAMFTLLAPFGIPIYHYSLQTTTRHNYSLRQWVLYTLAYCFLLLVTRDALEFVTQANLSLDNALTLCRITLAVFWFSIIRHDVRGSMRNIWQSIIWKCPPILRSGKETYLYVVTTYGRWVGALLNRVALPWNDLLYNVLGQTNYYSIKSAWYRMTNAFYWQHYLLSAIVFADDWTRYLTAIPTQQLYRRGRKLVNDLTQRRFLHIVSSLVAVGVVAGVGYMMYTSLLSFHPNPHTVLQLGSPNDYRLPTGVQLSQQVLPEARPWLAEYANNALAPFQQASKAYQQVLVSPTVMLMHLARLENPFTLIWQAVKKYFQNIVAVVNKPAKDKQKVEIRFYEDEELMTEVVKIGQVCYNEDKVELPCSYDPEAFEETSFVDMAFNGMRRIFGYLGIF
ncbi:hypothetical protein N0V93_008303 [Gnomoniopsis smithogilvyi]|uniref:Uncharacterized protein n=1 Tax=Gnomoniopsis smithogilvyi TaxID=1191159 RepID=A0A9W8YMQ9_9PEZI|nr:hypothetical protein N0V93_008303 [Gnomoniopsis smithogilvyi]